MELGGRALDRGQLGQVTLRLRATMLQFRACEWVNDVRNVLASDVMMGDEQEASLITRSNAATSSAGGGWGSKKRHSGSNDKVNRTSVGQSKPPVSRSTNKTGNSGRFDKPLHKQELLELFRALPASVQSFGMPRLANFFRLGPKFPIGPFIEYVDEENQVSFLPITTT